MTASEYFEDHPEARDSAIRASYAYHGLGAHNFASSDRTALCSLCGRTREEVRWGEEPPQCIEPVRPHRYNSGAPWAICRFCGVVRSEIGDILSNMPPALNPDGTFNVGALLSSEYWGTKLCLDHQPSLDRKEVLRREGDKYDALLLRGKTLVPRVLQKHGLSGTTLLLLHDTHGIDPETVAGVVDVSPELMRSYHEEKERIREISRAAHKPEIIKIKS